jgi:acylpyruvate hydrolase
VLLRLPGMVEDCQDPPTTARAGACGSVYREPGGGGPIDASLHPRGGGPLPSAAGSLVADGPRPETGWRPCTRIHAAGTPSFHSRCADGRPIDVNYPDAYVQANTCGDTGGVIAMRIVVFGPEQRVGAWEGEHIVDLNWAMNWYLAEQGEAEPAHKAASRLPARLPALIDGGPEALAEAQRVVAAVSAATFHARYRGVPVAHRASEVQLRAPWPGRRIACAGGNYAAHLAGMGANAGRATPPSLAEVAAEAKNGGQWGFWKVPHAVAGAGDPVPYPTRTQYLDYEGEAAIVIGKAGKNIPAGRVKDHIWGITLLNDLSIRDGGGGGRGMSYNLAKNFDGSTALGPSILVGDVDPQDFEVETRVNGQLRQRYNTRDMIWSFGEILEFLSRDFTFVPGDIIAGGTSVGTAADQTKRAPDGSRPRELFLKVGDTVEVSSPACGVLRNQIVAPTAG